MAAEVKTEQQLNDLLNDEGALAKALQEKMKGWWGDTSKETRAEFEAYAKDFVKKLVNGEHASTTKRRLPFDVKQPNPRAKGAQFDGKFADFGSYLSAVHAMNTNRGLSDEKKAGLGWIGEDGIVKAALAEGAGDTGGFLVPEEFRAQLLALAIEQAIIRPRAFTVPMTSSTMRFPTIKDTSHAASVYGGVVAYWESEAASLTESEPTFSQMQLIARKLTGYTIASNELLADSAIGLESILLQLFPGALTWFEEEAFINGTGVGQPQGLLGATCKVTVSAESGQASTTILYENINKMFARMLPTSRDNAFWLCNIDIMPQLAVMSLAVGTGGSAIWIPPGGAQSGFPMTIWGRPVVFTEHCQTLGTEGDIMFVDPRYYVIGDRQELSVMSSPHVKFTTDQTVWRFIERLDARPWLESPLTPAHGSNSLSPIVTLASR